MLDCIRYSGACDFRFQVEDKGTRRNGDKGKSQGFIYFTQHCQNRNSHGFDFRFQVEDKGTRRNGDKGKSPGFIYFTQHCQSRYSLGFLLRAQGTEFRAQSTGQRAQSKGHRAQGSGLRAQSSDSRVHAKTQGRKWDFRLRISDCGSQKSEVRGQIAKCNLENHFCKPGPWSSVSTLNFELYTLSLSFFEVVWKTKATRITINGVFTN